MLKFAYHQLCLLIPTAKWELCPSHLLSKISDALTISDKILTLKALRREFSHEFPKLICFVNFMFERNCLVNKLVIYSSSLSTFSICSFPSENNIAEWYYLNTGEIVSWSKDLVSCMLSILRMITWLRRVYIDLNSVSHS